ncbi:DUF1648 domain-containing protein [Bacillus dakarensis]|uniref:DUF1648 domain-containing protein n=1 Tax=Robertmurraya dakarensis TaxID=1926278 RepID=UPI000980F579|nr:DUF5808 domain-containing protein [Bacillus dakarensis]
MSLTIFLIIIVFMAGIQTAIPYLVKRTVIFGVTIPEQYLKDRTLSSYKRTYTILVSFISIIVLGLFVFWTLRKNPSEELIVMAGAIIQFGIIFFSMSLYFYFHGKTIVFKKKHNISDNVKHVQITDLSVRSQDEMLPWYVYLLPVLITVGLLGYTILKYDVLPEKIPTHWGPNGKPDAFTVKNPFSAVTLPLTLLVMQLMFMGINIGTKKSGIKLSAASTNASRIRQLTLRKYSSWFLFIVSVFLTMMLSFFHLTTIHPGLFIDKAMVAIPFTFLIIVLLGTLIFAVKVGRADKQTAEDPKSDITDIDEDSYWKGGLFYFNKNDPSIFVEKRFGVGWSINFANPMGYLIVVVPLLVILLLSFL